MVKKILPFLCSLAPLYAFGGEVPIETNPYQINLGPDEYANVASVDNINLYVGAGGINIDTLTVTSTPGAPADAGGDLYVVNTATLPYGIVSDGDVTIRKNMWVYNSTTNPTKGLQLSGPVAMNIGGDIIADGYLKIFDATSFTSGAISTDDFLSINAGQITTGLISSTDGDTSVVATGALNMGGIRVGLTSGAGTAPTTTIGGSTITTGYVQNLFGDMTVTTTGNFSAVRDAVNPTVKTGSVENSGAALTMNIGGSATIGGTLKNDLTTGTMEINAGALTVSGSDAVKNASFVNGGDTILNINGATSFVHGMNLTNMGATNELKITTGTLNLGTNNIIANTQSALVKIDVTGGALSAGAIVNGDEGGAATNSTTQTVLKGVGVNATSVHNYGNKLTIDTYDTAAANNVAISEGIVGAANAITNITASDALSVGGDVENSGTMNLYGANVTLASVTNTGNNAVLNVSAPTDTGIMRINNSVSNTGGTTTITAKDLALGTVTNTSGTLNVTASDTDGGALSIGSIAVNGGLMNLNAWLGNVATSTVDVASGAVLNLGSAVHNVTTSGAVNIARNVNVANAVTTGNGDLYLTSDYTTIKSGSNITIGGNVIATDSNTRTATLDGVTIAVNGDTGVNVQRSGNAVTFGSASSTSGLTVSNALNATNGGMIEIYSGTSSAKSLTESGGAAFVMHGNTFTATNGDINVADGVWYGGSSTPPVIGMIIDDNVAEFGLNSTTGNVMVSDGIIIGDGNALSIGSGNNVTVSGETEVDGSLAVVATNGVTFNNAITTGGDASPSLSVAAKTINTNGITNAGVTSLSATNGTATIQSTGAISNSGNFTAIANNNITFNDFDSTSGVVEITSNNGKLTTGDFSVDDGTVSVSANQVIMNSLSLDGGTTTISSADVDVSDDVSVNGNVIQGGIGTDVAALKLVNTTTFDANSLTISNGGFTAKSGNTTYSIAGNADLGDTLIVASGATSKITANTIAAGDITNGGTLNLKTTHAVSGMTFGTVENNYMLTLDTNGLLNVASFTNNDGAKAVITSADMLSVGEVLSSGIMYQNYSGTLYSGDMNITSTNYTITAPSVTVGGINQSGSSKMVLNTSDLNVGGDITANDLTIVAQNDVYGNPIWSNINVEGNVSGGVKIYGLEHMSVGGNYMYDDDSLLHVAVLPYATGSGINTTSHNYWADVSLAEDATLGQITNRDNDPENAALIYVDGRFDDDISSTGSVLEGSPLVSPEIGINLYDVVDQGSAIWLLYAKEGVSDLALKIRDLNINFCNKDGSICFNYFDAFSPDITNSGNNGTADDLPIYLSVRDYNNDGLNDSLYIVFDPRFGGPVTIFPIEPIVRRAIDSTDGQGDAANGLDNMVAGQLNNKGFGNNAPIEALPLVFQGTNLADLANELYNRMEQYVIDRDGTALKQFSRLVQPRELEQITGSIVLNEHTTFRDLEDHMFDEFIWNRNRNLSKAWFDADFGMMRIDGADKKNIKGNRFNITAGFDWQNSKKTVTGLMARVSRTTSKSNDGIDLTYIPGQQINGYNNIEVADTDIGIGGYLLHTLGTKARLYGNAMFDLHLLDLSREQNYVADIDGSGHAFSLIGEMGLLHDWLNQYIVGNLYARAGYNFGFSVKEESAGAEYMRMKSDGYLMLTPGYSLIAQKRIYPSSWFQIRPYASIGIEYDVLGVPSAMKYKFAPAHVYSEYDVETDPLWANIGGGVEMLSAGGIQFGLDYRYQYNSFVQLHNIRLSGSVRF